jgi:flagellar protein FliO/FliZ
MTKLNPLSRAVATATAVLGPCLLAAAWPAAAMAKSGTATGANAGSSAAATGENTPLNLPGGSGVPHPSGSGGSIVRTIVGLAIVIAVIWGLSWILRQVKSGKDPHVTSAGLTSIAALTLGTGRSVHLVRAGSDYLLLGSAEHGVMPIHRYTEEEARDAGLLDVVEAGGAGPAPRRSLLRAPARSGRPLLRPPVDTGGAPQGTGAGAGHDPMRMPARAGAGAGLGTSVIDRLRELTVRR